METNVCSHKNFTNSVDAAIKPVYGCLFFKFLNVENLMETKSLYIACLSLSTSVDKMETKPIDKSRAVRQTKNGQKPNHAVLDTCLLFADCDPSVRSVQSRQYKRIRQNKPLLFVIRSPPTHNYIPSHRDIHS